MYWNILTSPPPMKGVVMVKADLFVRSLQSKDLQSVSVFLVRARSFSHFLHGFLFDLFCVGLEPTTTRLRALRSTDWARRAPTEAWKFKHLALVVLHASTNCYLCLSTSCLLCRLAPFCSCSLPFVLLSFRLLLFPSLWPFFLVFCRFLFLFPSFCCLFPCLSLFCSLLLFFVFFPFVLLLFSASVRAFLFSFRLFFFAPLVPFSPLSFFLSPVSLALLLPPLCLGFFSSWNSCKYGASSSKDWLGYVE